jgi:nicotinamide-nucleotide amidase
MSEAKRDQTLTTLASELGERLRARGWRLAVAESCTGGSLAAALTEVAGCSAWFERGFVTYSNLAKEQSLGVSPATLITHGAVSEPTAREMALGALRAAPVQLTAAITGIAGPSGGTPEKPVGTVCFAWAMAGEILHTERLCFGGDRAAVRSSAVWHALLGLHAMLAGAEARGRVQ